MKNISMLIIDPQYDFCDVPDEYKAREFDSDTNKMSVIEPALPVVGAWDDSIRLSQFINKGSHLIESIDVTLDTHQEYDISHPIFWKDKTGKHPDPFTPISNQEIKDGIWIPVDRTKKDYALEYTESLESAGLYSLFIWPTHCLVGEAGHNVISPIMKSLKKWEKKYITRVNYVTKGHNPYTEHYGGFEAEYPLPNDPTTQLNMPLIEKFQESDLIFLSGQALSHCVASTVRQLANNFGEENIKKLVILEDTCSPVTGFEQNAIDFIEEMKQRGATVTDTSKIKITRTEFIF